MGDSESLYRAILINPADDAPRLIYADWLEENGDLERAELVRHMVHFPRDRAGYRPPNPGSVYWPDAPAWVGYGVRRGFVAEIGLTTSLFLAHAAELFARHPITRVVLHDRQPLPRSLKPTVSAVITSDSPEVLFHWPPELFPKLRKGAEVVFESYGHAHRLLKSAAVAFGRRAAGLPPLDSV